MKQRITASKEQVVELERKIKTLEIEAEKHKAHADKTDVMKLALARKDALIKSQKEQLEQLRVELLSFQEIASSRNLDGEKRTR